MMRYRGRGRPPQHKPQHDHGTKELQAKRARGVTEELLDRYLRLEYINAQQHWCGNHFRWLYSMRFGVPNVSATDLSGHSAGYVAYDDEAKHRALTEKYRQALQALSAAHALSAVMDVAIYSQCHSVAIQPRAAQHDLGKALDILVDLWCS